MLGQPAAPKARAAQAFNDRLAAARQVPNQLATVVLNHENNRSLVDSEVIRRNPPAGWAILIRKRLIKRRFETVQAVLAHVHLSEVAKRRDDDLRRKWE